MRPPNMRRWLHRGAVTVLAAALGVLLPLAQPQTYAGTPPRAPARVPTVLARFELSALSPRVVTLTSAAVLRVSGRVVNLGERPITNLGIRLSRDEPVSSEAAAAREWARRGARASRGGKSRRR